MKKRILSLLLTLCMVVSLLPTAVFAAKDNFTDQQIANSDLKASFADGTLTISGNGPMPDYKNANDTASEYYFKNRLWNGYTIKDIVIGNGVTRIGDLAFIWSGNTAYARIPESVTSIGYASYVSGANNRVIVPATVTSVGNWSITDGNDVYFLGESTTPALDELENPNSAEPYNIHVIAGSTTASSFKAKAQKNATVVEHTAMGACGTDPVYPSLVAYTYDKDTKTLTIVGNGPMKDYSSADETPWASCDIENVVIGAGITHLGNNAFGNASAVDSVVLASTLDTFGESVFPKDKEKTIKFSYAVGSNADKWVKSLGNTSSPDKDQYNRPMLTKTDDEYYREYISDTLLIATLKKDGTLRISGKGAMPNFESGSDQSSNGNAGKRPWFDDYWTARGDNTNYRALVKKIVIENGITQVGDYSFLFWGSNNVTSLEIADSVTRVGEGAFWSLGNISVAVVPAQLTYVGHWFAGASADPIYVLGKDTQISYRSTASGWSIRQNENCTVHVVAGGKAEKNIRAAAAVSQTDTFKIVTHTAMGACGVAPYSSNVYYVYDQDTQSLQILGHGAMKDYTESDKAPWADYNIEKITVSADVTSIGKLAFNQSGIKTVYIAPSVESIDETSFILGENNSELKKIQFMCDEDSYAKKWLDRHDYSASATSGTTGEVAWKLSGNTLTISGTGAMADYSAGVAPWSAYADIIKNVVIEKGVTKIGANAFADLTSVENVTIHWSVAEIGNEAFKGCSKLSKLYIPENVGTIGTDVFKDCASTVELTGHDKLNELVTDKTQGTTTINITTGKQFKVLILGNSFSRGVQPYLQTAAKQAGYTDVVIGTFSPGGEGGNLNAYAGMIKNSTKVGDDTKFYYYENGAAQKQYYGMTILDCLGAQDWDYIAVEYFGTEAVKSMSSDSTNKANIDTVVNALKQYANPTAKYACYQTWSSIWDVEDKNSGTDLYDVWQKMVAAYDFSKDENPFAYRIPAATTIQNIRQSYFENGVSSGGTDKLHLNGVGNYAVAMTFMNALTGTPVEKFSSSGVSGGLDVICKAGTEAAVQTPNALKAASVNGNYYSTIAEAVRAAQAGDAVEVYAQCKNADNLVIPANVTVKTYGSEENHVVVSAGTAAITATGLVVHTGDTLDSSVVTASKAIDPKTGETSTVYEITAGDGIKNVAKDGETVSFTVEDRTGYTVKVAVKAGDTDVDYTNADGTYTFNMPTADVSITATYTPITYTITYDLDGGTNAKANPDSYTVEQTVTLAEPTCEGYTFTGWTGTDLTEATKEVTLNGVTGDRTYKANWTINSYTAKWTGIATDIEETYKYGDTITKPADPTKAGYTFKGWDGYTENMTMPADNVIFTAQWERNTLTLTPNKTEAVGEFKVILTVGEAAGDITVTCDDETITVIKNDDGTYTAVLPNPDEEKTYTFTAVDADDNSKATCTVKLTHDATNDEYNISASSGVTPSVEKSKSGETVTFTVAEKTGYTAAVTVKDADSAAVEATEKDGTYSFTMPAKTVSIVATYTPITYTITYDLDGGTNAKANPDSYTVEQTVTLAEPTREGYIFTGWTWDGQTEAAKTAVIAKGTTGNKTFKANWKEEEKTPTITDFTDVKSGDWFYDSVKWALDQKITNGTSETTYSPAQGCTRAQIVTFLWRAFGEPEPTTTENPFTDVTQDENHKCYYKAILWAAEKGITTGTTETTFSPNEYCTRAQIVTFLYRAAGKPEPKGGKMPFEDVKQGDYYYNAVLWACENGIAKGMTATTFEPGTTCTRAQSVTFVYRAEDFLG